MPLSLTPFAFNNVENVLLEEYTGGYCSYCPNGHRIANEVAAKYPGRVFPVNIHAGGFAYTDYPNMTTTQGNEYNNNFGVTSYPTGILNRVGQVSYTQWENKVDEMMKENAIVNIAGDYTINAATRTAQITVEMYYTGNSSESTNYLTIYMLQDDIVGYQAGSNLNPTQIVDGQYNHTHVFRSAITSTWGDAVSPTTAGSLITKTYTYTIVGFAQADPAAGKISDESPVGKALIGHKKGEKVTVEVPNGTLEFKSVEITR